MIALLSLARCAPAEPATDAMSTQDASALEDTPLPEDSATSEPDAAPPRDSAAMDVVSDRPDPVDARAPRDTGVSSCDGASTFACGAIRCTLFEVCAQSRAGDRCYAPTSRDRCTPCSTQFASALPRDFCSLGVRSYDGDSTAGCTVRCN